MLNNQNKFYKIESFILSLPILLLICVFLQLAVLFFDSNQTDSIRILFISAFFVLTALSLNIIFFLVLKNKLNLGIETFFYGIGFLSSYIALGTVLSFLMDNTIEVWVFYYYGLPLVSLFYTYATALKNTEKGVNKITLFLMLITIAFFIIGFVKDFEILKLKENYELFTFYILPILFGLYIGYYAVYRTIRISLRNVAWTPFLIILIIGFGILFYLELIYVNGLPVHLAIFYFLFSLIVSCLIGTICKQYQKKQIKMQTNE